MAISIRQTKFFFWLKCRVYEYVLNNAFPPYLVYRKRPTLRTLKTWTKDHPVRWGLKVRPWPGPNVNPIIGKERCSWLTGTVLTLAYMETNTNNGFWDTLKGTLNTWSAGYDFQWSTSIFKHYLRNHLGLDYYKGFRNLYVPKFKEISSSGKRKMPYSLYLFSSLFFVFMYVKLGEGWIACIYLILLEVDYFSQWLGNMLKIEIILREKKDSHHYRCSCQLSVWNVWMECTGMGWVEFLEYFILKVKFSVVNECL